MLIVAFGRSDGSLRSHLFGSSGSKSKSCSPVVLSSVSFAVRMFEQVNSNWHGIPCKKIPCYLGELMRQMADRLIAHHYLSIGLSQTPFSLIDGFHTHWFEREHFHVAWLPSYRFASFSYALFPFISTVGFSNEDNCCQSEVIGKSIKKMLFKGILRVD